MAKTFQEYMNEKYGQETVINKYDQAKSALHNSINEALLRSEQEQINKQKALLEQRSDDIRQGFRNAYGTYISPEQKARVAANEYLFREEFTKRVLSNILTEVIDSSLLLDTKKYSELNEKYKNEIKERVSKLLESTKLNADKLPVGVKSLFEAIVAATPASYTIYKLQEDADIYDISNKLMNQEDVRKTLRDLNVDVREKVADIVMSDNEYNNTTLDRMMELNQTVDQINSEHDMANQDAVPAVPVQDINNNTTDAENQYTQQDQNQTVAESYCTGILESLVLNEAKLMINETGSYNDDLAMANAIKFITVLESFNATGLLTVGKNEYRQIIESSRAANITTFESYINNSLNEQATGIKAQPINENSVPTAAMSFAQWEKEKLSMLNVAEQNNMLVEDVYVANPDYIAPDGRIMSENAVRNLLENYGFNFTYDSFNDACAINGFVRRK